RKKHSIIIGDQTAEKLKIEIASAMPLKKERTINIKGRDLGSGMPREVEVTSQQMYEALEQPLSRIVKIVKEVLEEVPPELAADIIDKGVVMTGGTSTLRNLDALIRESTGVPAAVAERPLYCVIQGIGVALENLDLYKRSLGKK